MTSRAPAGVADVCADCGGIEAELSVGDLDGLVVVLLSVEVL